MGLYGDVDHDLTIHGDTLGKYEWESWFTLRPSIVAGWKFHHLVRFEQLSSMLHRSFETNDGTIWLGSPLPWLVNLEPKRNLIKSQVI